MCIHRMTYNIYRDILHEAVSEKNARRPLTSTFCGLNLFSSTCLRIFTKYFLSSLCDLLVFFFLLYYLYVSSALCLSGSPRLAFSLSLDSIDILSVLYKNKTLTSSEGSLSYTYFFLFFNSFISFLLSHYVHIILTALIHPASAFWFTHDEQLVVLYPGRLRYKCSAKTVPGHRAGIIEECVRYTCVEAQSVDSSKV